MDYVIEVLESLWLRRAEIAGVRNVSAPPVLRHIRARYERLPRPTAGG
jgi:tryptophanase